MNKECESNNKTRVSIIAAIGRNRELGKGKELLWHIPEDFKHFKKTTMGKPIIMGSTTFESIGRALPGRLNIVLSHDDSYKAKGCEVMHSLEDAIDLATDEWTRGPLVHSGQSDSFEMFIIGGGFVYKQALEEGLVDRLYLTLIDTDFAEADVFFPEYEKAFGFTQVVEERDSKKGETFTYKFVTVERDERPSR